MNLNLFPADLLVHLDAAGQPYTTSLAVADAFGKSHKNVLRDIKAILTAWDAIPVSVLSAINAENHGIPDLSYRLKFEPVNYTDPKGESRPMYHLQRSAFMLLVMGYTGSKALICKLRFLAAFDTMEQLLSEHHARYQTAFTRLRPRLAIIADHPDMSRHDLIQLTGHRSEGSITAGRRRARELGLLH